MADLDLIEQELVTMLANFKEAIIHLGRDDRSMGGLEQKRMIGSKIAESTNTIGVMLDNAGIFDLAEEDLNQQLEALKHENDQLHKRLKKAKRNMGIHIIFLFGNHISKS